MPVDEFVGSVSSEVPSAAYYLMSNPGVGQNSTVISLALQLHSDFIEI
jgi:hypothetical protein